MDSNQKKQYINLAKFLHAALGSEFEIVLHEFDFDKHNLLYLANGHISGRTVEDYTIESLYDIIDNTDIKTNNFHINSQGLVYNNKVIKHSTFFIKDDTNNLIGILCINFDGSKYVNIAKKILQLTNMENASIENDRLHTFDFQNNLVSDVVSDIANSVFDDALSLSTIPIDMLSQEEKIEIVRELNNKEVFLMKGSITNAAKKLGVSKATIYRYLQIINEENENLI